MSDGSEIKILLVDDREDNLISMQAILERDGYTLRKANSGQQALKILLQEVDFTLILMDVLMPNLNGFDTASLIYEREKLKHIPIIFITANNNDNNAFKGYQAGAADYIYKPINPDLLRAKVSVFVELYRKNHQLMVQERKLLQINNELEERVKKRTAEIYKKNAELEFKNEELSKLNIDLDNFIYTASHDLKAPISNIEGLLAALFSEIAERTDHIDKIKSLTLASLDKLKRTILDLTEITKVQKESTADMETIQFEEMLEEVKLTIQDSIKQNKATIITEIDTPEIQFSKKNLRSIIYNLVSNAVKYCSPERAPVVRVKTEKKDGSILFTVSDNGLGIKPENYGKLFNMFTRLHDHVEGTGIGLYIVKRIIENNGGTIEVTSTLNEGTTFSVNFKCVDIPAPALRVK